MREPLIACDTAATDRWRAHLAVCTPCFKEHGLGLLRGLLMGCDEAAPVPAKLCAEGRRILRGDTQMLASRITGAAAKMRHTPIIETLEPIDDTLVIRCPVCGGVVATWDLDRLHWIVGDGEPDARPVALARSASVAFALTASAARARALASAKRALLRRRGAAPTAHAAPSQPAPTPTTSAVWAASRAAMAQELAGASTPRASKSKKSGVPVLVVGEDVKKLATRVREVKEQLDNAESMYETLGAELLQKVAPLREDLCRRAYQSSVRVPDSKRMSIGISWADKYCAIPAENEAPLRG